MQWGGVTWGRRGRLSVLVGCAPQADEEVGLWGGAKVAAVTLKPLRRHPTLLPVWTRRTRRYRVMSQRPVSMDTRVCS